jgi:AAA domain
MSQEASPAVERDSVDTEPGARGVSSHVDPILLESATADAAAQGRPFVAALNGDLSELTKLPDDKRELLAWMTTQHPPVRHQTFYGSKPEPVDWETAPSAAEHVAEPLPGFAPETPSYAGTCPSGKYLCHGCTLCMPEMPIPTVEELEDMFETPTAPEPTPEPEDAEQHEWPISLGDLGARVRSGEGAARDLLLDGQIVTVVGEEGEGKSTLAWQIACQLAAGEDIGGYFEVVEPVSPVLIVDVEQSEEDATILRDDMLRRGLKIEGVLWLDAQGRMFDTVADQKWLTERIRAIGPQVVILDTGTEAVTKPREDDSVKPLFITLYRYLKAEGVRTVVMLGQPRKRSQDAPSSRKFDDLFGSRVWKGRSSAVLYLEQERLTVWKQRGSYIRRRWGSISGRLKRSDVGPTMILAPQPEDEARVERRNTVLAAVGVNNGKLSKSSLIEDELHVPGHARAAWKRTVEDLIDEGEIEARGQYKKLFLVA